MRLLSTAYKFLFIISIFSSAPVFGTFGSEQVVQTKSIAVVSVGDYEIEILPGSRNAGRPMSQRQFFYRPILIPETRQEDRESGLAQALDIRRHGNNGLVTLRLTLKNQTIHDEVYRRLLDFYSNEDDVADLNPDSIRTLPVQQVNVEIINFPQEIGSYESSYSLNAARFFDLRINLNSPDHFDQLLEHLPNAMLKVETVYNARMNRENRVNLTLEHLDESQLGAALRGLQTDIAYVHRNQLRDILRRVSGEIRVDGVIENPDRFSLHILENLINSQFVKPLTVSFDDWNDQLSQRMYNPRDLDPSTIKNYLNDHIKKVQGKEEWQFDTGGSGGIKGSLFGIVSGEVDGNATFTRRGLREWLNEEGIKIEFSESDLIIPKSIELVEVDMGIFSRDYVVADVRQFVTSAEAFTSTDEVAMFNYAGGRRDEALPVLDSNAQLGILSSRVLDYFETLPKGTILPFAGNQKDLVGTSWVVCSKESHDISEGVVPDLTERFLAGAKDASDLHRTGGRNDIPSDGAFSLNKEFRVTDRGKPHPSGFQRKGDHNHFGKAEVKFSIPNHSHGGENRPPFHKVFWIMVVDRSLARQIHHQMSGADD